MSEQVHSSKLYVKIWFWLLAITVAGLIISPLALPGFLHNLLMVIVGLMKASLIIAYFMHLKYERLTFIYSILLPVILILALVFALLFEGTNRWITDAGAQCVMCQASIASAEETDTIASGLNAGILYLLSVPYLIFIGFAIYIYRTVRLKRNER